LFFLQCLQAYLFILLTWILTSSFENMVLLSSLLLELVHVQIYLTWIRFILTGNIMSSSIINGIDQCILYKFKKKYYFCLDTKKHKTRTTDVTFSYFKFSFLQIEFIEVKQNTVNISGFVVNFIYLQNCSKFQKNFILFFLTVPYYSFYLDL
jgi:hypothetical protein